MNILVNASNLRAGGGLQVADSVCRELHKYPQHEFTVVLPSQLDSCAKEIERASNISVVRYNLPLNARILLTGRDKTMDSLVESKNIRAVISIFGPTRWTPRRLHLCGIAMPHIVLTDSPFWKRLSTTALIKAKIRNRLMLNDFRRCSKLFYTENEYISERFRTRLPGAEVVTITNNYNQIFDHPEAWDDKIVFPPFEGLTLLTVSNDYPHKNLSIIGPTLDELRRRHPDVKVRFALTVDDGKSFADLSDEARKNILFLGTVGIRQCPPLYRQSDIVLQPSLLECFSANYVEAMKMGLPILTTDLGFARSLCGDAAEYYSAADPTALADAIAKLYRSPEYRSHLVEKGKKQSALFDTYEDRARKLIETIERHA